MATVKGDQTIKKNLYVDLTMQAEQVTSTDDMTMAGYFLNTLNASDTTGMFIDGTTNPLTTEVTNYLINSRRTLTGTAAGSGFNTYGIYNTITNSKSYDQQTYVYADTYGSYSTISIDGGISSVHQTIENDFGSFSSISRDGTITAGALAEPTYITVAGQYANGAIGATFNKANANYELRTYGGKFEGAGQPMLTAGNLISDTYGVYATAVGSPDGTSTAYGVYTTAIGANTNWAFYNFGASNNFLGNDNSKTFFGTGKDASIYYDATNMVINPKEVGTGVLKVAGNITPSSNDGFSLGTTGLQFSDLFLAEGGVINWDNGDATLTQVGDVVTLAGADLKVTTPGNVATSVLTTNGAQVVTGKSMGMWNYAADAGANDTYVITLSPAITAYETGQVIFFKANTANTGAASLNVNGLGAITIVKAVSTTLANNDILASMFCMVVYNGTNFVLMNPRVL